MSYNLVNAIHAYLDKMSLKISDIEYIITIDNALFCYHDDISSMLFGFYLDKIGWINGHDTRFKSLKLTIHYDVLDFIHTINRNKKYDYYDRMLIVTKNQAFNFRTACAASYINLTGDLFEDHPYDGREFNSISNRHIVNLIKTELFSNKVFHQHTIGDNYLNSVLPIAGLYYYTLATRSLRRITIIDKQGNAHPYVHFKLPDVYNMEVMTI